MPNALAKRQLLAAPERDERMALVWEYYIQNIPITAIARYVGVSVDTVKNDIDFMRRLAAADVGRVRGLELMAEVLAKYRELYGMARTEIDGSSGKARAAWMRLAKDVLQAEQGLLQSVGAIPTEPQRLEHTISGQINHEHTHVVEVRSDEDIEADIKKLLQSGMVLDENG